jgi:hypothetical protein
MVYEAYLYRFTDIDSGRMYIGIHKGEFGDGYWHSSQDKEFNELLANNNANLKLEILQYGDYNALTVEEYKMLTEVNAKDNDLYFNKSNGSPKYKAVDTKKCKEFVARIVKGEFDSDMKEPIEVVKKLPTLQVRATEFSDHITLISQKIDDAGGNTDGCNRVVIYVDRRGRDIIGDGNHTVRAINKSKHGNLVPTARIPKEEHEDFTDSELIAIGNLLNKSEKVVKISASIDDMVKFVLKQYAQGVPVNDDANKVFLTEMGFTSKQRTSIFKSAQIEVDANNYKKGEEVWIDWRIPEYANELQKKVASYRDAKTLAISLSSGMFKWDNVFNHVFDKGTKPIGKEGRKRIASKIVIVVHHPTRELKKDWDDKINSEVKNKLSFYLGAVEMDFQIKEMKTTRKNEAEKYYEKI